MREKKSDARLYQEHLHIWKELMHISNQLSLAAHISNSYPTDSRELATQTAKIRHCLHRLKILHTKIIVDNFGRQ